ncbi:MAG: NAD(P)H-hydrate dehydratase [Acidiferrobacterales bacterium]|nr:NAD(P)H-hydrate dehydratase [Acidiferrobacterales bacterium]
MQPSSIDLSELSSLLAKRAWDSHKGNYGHVLIIGGNAGMAGAALLAAEAAARTGAGLVSVATIEQHAAAALGTCKEIMVHGINTGCQLSNLLNKASVIAIGPGLGQDKWAHSMFQIATAFEGPSIFDADALHMLRESTQRNTNRILTPHPGEAASLLNCDTKTVQSDRNRMSQSIQKRFGGVCVLKGAGTLVASENALSISLNGNPGMASGGMGDALTGIIAGLCAQGLNTYDAAKMGVELHGQAADIAAKDGMRGMLASDLLLPLRKLIS